MPKYDFRCEQCDKDFEIPFKISDEKIANCQICGGKLRRIWNKIDIHYNGTGFTLQKGRNKAGEPITSRKN